MPVTAARSSDSTTAKRKPPPVRTRTDYGPDGPLRPGTARPGVLEWARPRHPRANEESPEMSRYEGRVAVVTGSARGIGAATAARLASEGASVAVLDLDQSAAQVTAGGLPVQGAAQAAGFAVDVADAASVEAGVAAVVERFGRVDVLVNNA